MLTREIKKGANLGLATLTVAAVLFAPSALA